MRCRNAWLVLGWAVVCLVCGCKGKVSSPEDAQLKDNVYTNRFFGFQIQVPDTWTVLKKPSAREVRQGTEAVLGGDKELAAAAAQAAKSVHYLLMARNVVVGMSLGVTAESIAHIPEVQTGQDYLEHTVNLLTGEGKPLQPVTQIAPATLASRDFHRVDLAGNFMGMRYYQAMFVTIEKGYVLAILVGAKSQAGVDEVLGKVGLAGTGTAIADARKGVQTVAARQVTRPPSFSSDPAWVSEIKLQGIGGTGNRRLAIINGKTFAPGDGGAIKTTLNTVVVRCVAIGEASARVTIEGVDGERELRIGGN